MKCILCPGSLVGDELTWKVKTHSSIHFTIENRADLPVCFKCVIRLLSTDIQEVDAINTLNESKTKRFEFRCCGQRVSVARPMRAYTKIKKCLLCNRKHVINWIEEGGAQ